jgi:hypothetical protein
MFIYNLINAATTIILTPVAIGCLGIHRVVCGKEMTQELVLKHFGMYR